jgi:ribosomal protein S18 acetylase RimI-like enzyme
MELYIDFCIRMNIRTFYLEVSPLNEGALRLYQSFSYRSYGTRKRFYRGREDALLMVKRV